MIYEQIFYDDEAHFENVAKKQLKETLKDFMVVDFKPLVLSDQGIRRRPDLAIIDRRYRMWVVVEVELEHHSLDHHVLPQMQVLASGTYDITHADYLAQASPGIDRAKARELITYVPPEVMTLVNSRSVLDKGWGVLESDLQVRLTFLEIFRSETGDSIFRLSGFTPQIKPEHISGAKAHPMMNALVCRRPNAIPVAAGTTIWMSFDGRPIRWQVIKTADTAVLMPRPSVTLRRDRNYEIVRAEDGRLVLQTL